MRKITIIVSILLLSISAFSEPKIETYESDDCSVDIYNNNIIKVYTDSGIEEYYGKKITTALGRVLPNFVFEFQVDPNKGYSHHAAKHLVIRKAIGAREHLGPYYLEKKSNQPEIAKEVLQWHGLVCTNLEKN